MGQFGELPRRICHVVPHRAKKLVNPVQTSRQQRSRSAGGAKLRFMMRSAACPGVVTYGIAFLRHQRIVSMSRSSARIFAVEKLRHRSPLPEDSFCLRTPPARLTDAATQPTGFASEPS